MFNNPIYESAFKQLDLLYEQDFNLNKDSADDIKDFVDEAEEDTEVDVIDLDAEDENDLDESNVGKIILQCPCCETIVCKSKDEIELPEDCEDDEDCRVQIGEQCPVCFSEEGYKIIGQVAPYEEVEVEIEPKDEEENSDDTDNDTEMETDFDDSVTEKTFEEKDRKKQESLTEGIFTFNNFDDWYNHYISIWDDCEEKYANLEMAFNAGYNNTDWNNFLRKYKDLFENLEYIECAFDAGVDLKTGHNSYEEEDLDESLITESKCEDGCCENDTDDESLTKYFIDDNTINKYLNTLKNAGLNLNERTLRAAITYSNGSKDDIMKNIAKFCTQSKETLAKIKKVLSSMTEGLNDINLETDTDRISIHAEQKADNGEEMIAPLDFQAANEIVDNQPSDEEATDYLDDIETGEEGEDLEAPLDTENIEEPLEDELPEDDTEEDVPVDDFDEESFDGLGESYFKSVYDNVTSYLTESVREKGDKLIVEGIITFNSGNQRKTQFIVEGNTISNTGKCKMLAENLQITPGQKAFNINGTLNNGKFISESLSYNYNTNGVGIKGNINLKK